MATIWIDGDACPKPIKDISFRAAIRTKIPLRIVSNHFLSIPSSPWIKAIQVGAGFDVVDTYIVQHIKAQDLIITADIPFAHAVVQGGGQALNPRGTLYTSNNIDQLLARRHANESLRGAGLLQGGPSALSARDIQQYANQLDRILHKMAGGK